MQVQSMNQMRHMYQTQSTNQAQGNGQGKGMGQIMRSLSQDQREEVSNLLQNIPQEDRKSVVDQIKSLDVNSLSSDELYQSIMDILNPTTQSEIGIITSTSIDTYA